MKVLMDHPLPFLLTHGGFQLQLECTMAALRAIGVETEPLRWWDDQQSADVIHYFGRPSAAYVEAARQKGIKVILAELLTQLGSRSGIHRAAQKTFIFAAQKALPQAFTARMAWNSFREVDACVALTPWEAQLMIEMFGAPPQRVHVVPNGVEEIFLRDHSTKRGKWLVCTATIAERKRVLELAQACLLAETPIWIVGKPYAESDPYALRFFAFANQHPDLVRYEGPINDRGKMAEIYREARAFVLLSAWESLSLSALEAAACGCPLLLSDLPWARTSFAQEANYCRLGGSAKATSETLRKFYADAPDLPRPRPPKRWTEVAHQLRLLYESVIRGDAENKNRQIPLRF